MLGTLSAPTLPSFSTNNPLPDGFPWANATVSNTNSYTITPQFGVSRVYHFNIAHGSVFHGVTRRALLVNGAFPAPLLEADRGDPFNITMCNNIAGPEEGTALHWHGML